MNPPSTPAGADRNLLFGILALQMDFLTRDELVTGLNAWVLAKQKSLGMLLIEQQAIDPKHRDLIEAMVAAHIDRHGGDPALSLAAVTTDPASCAALETLAHSDPDLGASLVHVHAGPANDEADPFFTRANSTVAYTSQGLRFQILRPHARGGLGVVFVARDAELNREVALKEIQQRHAHDPTSRARFLNEAEITGGLEHPGIVPVYSLGAYPDGRPYYAMRFIRGESLKDAIERFHADEKLRSDPGARTLALQKLLRRFLDVCNAIQYAHDRGVLHRDLKPANILVGKYGETLVVDWGLAKAQGAVEGARNLGIESEMPLTLSSGGASSGSETLAGSALGTPAFMSPEQAVGRLDALGPASDVYSLGATLYHLITGRVPFEGCEVALILQRVQRGDFPPPHEVKSDVSRHLEKICLKAMARRPEDRYISTRALAGDLEHWLADEPIAAWREPFSLRLRRWERRHRLIVSVGSACLVTALISGGIGLLLHQREQSRLAQQRQAVDHYRQTASALVELASLVTQESLAEIPRSPVVAPRVPALSERPGAKTLELPPVPITAPRAAIKPSEPAPPPRPSPVAPPRLAAPASAIPPTPIRVELLNEQFKGMVQELREKGHDTQADRIQQVVQSFNQRFRMRLEASHIHGGAIDAAGRGNLDYLNMLGD